MIARFLSLLCRVLLESAVMLLVAGALLLVLSYRVGRRLVVSSPDRLERLTGAPWYVPAAVRALEAIVHMRQEERVDSNPSTSFDEEEQQP